MRRLGFQIATLIATMLFGALLALAQAPPAAGSAQSIVNSTNPNDLVAKVVENELHSRAEGHFLYRNWHKTPTEEKTKEMVETTDGVVARLVAINNQPLTPQQQAEESARLENLLQHPELQKQKQKEQQQDEEHVTKMFRELPKAFIFQFAGIQPDKSGELINLNFTPNQNYVPPDRETAVFKSMSGRLQVAVPDYRLARIEATLFREVSFGWGILGRLDKGGHFIVEQTKIGPNRWEATYMNIQFTGKALLFKTINMREIERLSNFQRVPDSLTLAQGIEMLKKTNASQLAENTQDR